MFAAPRCFCLSLTGLKGRQIGQSWRAQFFQWVIIWRDDAQCATGNQILIIGNSNTIKVFAIYIYSTKKKPNHAEIHNKAWLCVTELFTLFQFSTQIETSKHRQLLNHRLIFFCKIQVQYCTGWPVTFYEKVGQK